MVKHLNVVVHDSDLQEFIDRKWTRAKWIFDNIGG